jgi:hypothetical protein
MGGSHCANDALLIPVGITKVLETVRKYLNRRANP